MTLPVSPAIGMALAAAVLFGASTPLAKIMLGQTGPWMLAGLLYLGAGCGLAVLRFSMRWFGKAAAEAPLRRADFGRLTAVVLFGGVAGPLLLMLGLQYSTGAEAALLLNLESVLTLGIAWLVFRENVDIRIGIGATAIVVGAALLSWSTPSGGPGPGAALIAAACLCWAIDNNLSRGLSAADPLQVAMIKGLVAGSINFGLALLAGDRLPVASSVAASLVIGLFGYGISLVLFMLSLRHLGTARTGAYFSLAPFIGALLAVLFMQEPLSWRLVVAGLLMGLGLYLHLAERHSHAHRHEPAEHEHAHVHDAHHQHAHALDDPPGEPHVHIHRHDAIAHAHPHFPDIHHRHDHMHG